MDFGWIDIGDFKFLGPELKFERNMEKPILFSNYFSKSNCGELEFPGRVRIRKPECSQHTTRLAENPTERNVP